MKPEAFIKAGFTLIACLLLQQAASAQVKMGGVAPGIMRGDAVLELNSTKQGLLLPRVSSTALTTHPLDTAANGLMVFVTDQNSLFVRKSASWKQLLASDDAPPSTVTSINGATGAVNFTAGTAMTLTGTQIINDGVFSFNTRKGAVTASEGDYNLDHLGDVAIAAPANNQLLRYNAGSWSNWTPDFLKSSPATLTQGSVLFAGASGVVSESNTKLFWDNANGRLGVGTAAPNRTLTVVGNAGVVGDLTTESLAVTGAARMGIRTVTTNTTPIDIAATDYTVIISPTAGTGTITVRLPDPTANDGRIIVIKKTVNRTVNVTSLTVANFERAAGPTTITGATTLFQGTANNNNAVFRSMTFQSDGTRWYMIGN
jgi:hypothetical protein